jgi:hypothetical protein
MFDIDFTDCDAAETLARAAAAHERQRRSELELILSAQHYARLHPSPVRVRDDVLPGGEQGRVYGGDGCPEIAEFAVAEFGVMTGRSPGSAAKFIGQAVALEYRFPLTWERVQSGDATGWRALQVVQECVTLSFEAAAIVDRRVADIIDSVTFLQLQKIMKAASWEADPDAAKAKAKAEAKERGVWIGRTDHHGTTRLYIKATTGDVIALNATIAQLADALAALGDSDPVDLRRAKAAGLLSDPDLAADLLAAAQHLATTHPTEPVDDEPAAGGDPEPVTPPLADQADQTCPGDHLAESDLNDEADRDTPHPATPGHPLDDHTAPDTAFEPATQRIPDPASHHSSDRSKKHADHRVDDDALIDGLADGLAEPGVDDEADRDSPHPSTPDHPLDQERPSATEPEPDSLDRGRLIDPAAPPDERRSILRSALGSGRRPEPADDPARAGMDTAARLELRRKIDAARRDRPNQGRRIYQTVVNLHITDETLLAGGGIARVEGYGPVYTDQLEELLGHHRIVLRPVIDLNTALSVHAYEIPTGIRDQVNLRYPVEQFPYGTGETRTTTNPTSGARTSSDLDHIQPYRPDGSPDQTNTNNLAPLLRFSHRLKTHGDWTVRRIDKHTLEWTTKHGFKFHVDHNGTHPVRGPEPPTTPPSV